MASAAFLCTRCLLQLAKECNDDTIANIIKSDFYIDDLNTGAESESELPHIYKNIKEILDSACFPLRKVRTNRLQVFAVDDTMFDPIDLTKESSVLGLKYSPKLDIIEFPSKVESPPEIITKKVLPFLHPLGLFVHALLRLKSFCNSYGLSS